MKKILMFSLFSFLYFSFSAAQSGPKAQLCEQYLGTKKFDSNAPAGVIFFNFKEGTLKRFNSKGDKTYRQLLLGNGFINTKSSGLLGIIHQDLKKIDHLIQRVSPKSYNPVVVATAPPVEEPVIPPARKSSESKPKSEAVVKTETPADANDLSTELTPMDSMKIAIYLENLEKATKKRAAEAQTVWEAIEPKLRWFLTYLWLICLIILLLCRFIAKSIQHETIMLISERGGTWIGPKLEFIFDNAIGIGLMMIWAIMVPLLISLSLWIANFFSFDGGLVSILFGIVAILLLGNFAAKISDWILPNLKVQQPNAMISNIQQAQHH